MRTIWRNNYQAPRTTRGITRRWLSDERRFAESDHVIIHSTRSRDVPPVLLGPLRPGKHYDSHRGTIRHDDIIGKAARDVFDSIGKKTTRFRLHEVRLEDYVVLCRRHVTPIYPYDANLIVSLLDLHPDPRDTEHSESTKPQIEILEAGTGNGALTLYLSRAIHAANGPRPTRTDGTSEEAYNDSLKAWKDRRQAVIHTVEAHEKHSKHASEVVRGFRHGQYHGNIDFNVGNVSDWVKKALEDRSGQPFLTHAFLDLPGVQDHAATAAAALKTDGALIIFCPSITQINECALNIRKGKVPLDMDRVLELGVNGGTGGRLWDVRLVKPRALTKQNATNNDAVTSNLAERSKPEMASSQDADADVESLTFDTQTQATEMSIETSASEAQTSAIETSTTTPTLEQPPSQDEGWQLVCRPKVFERVAGGGFLAVFKKKSVDDTQDTLAVEL